MTVRARARTFAGRARRYALRPPHAPGADVRHHDVRARCRMVGARRSCAPSWSRSPSTTRRPKHLPDTSTKPSGDSCTRGGACATCEGDRPRARRQPLLPDAISSRSSPISTSRSRTSSARSGAPSCKRCAGAIATRTKRSEKLRCDLFNMEEDPFPYPDYVVLGRALLRDHRAPVDEPDALAAGDPSRPGAGRHARDHDAERRTARKRARARRRYEHLRPLFRLRPVRSTQPRVHDARSRTSLAVRRLHDRATIHRGLPRTVAAVRGAPRLRGGGAGACVPSERPRAVPVRASRDPTHEPRTGLPDFLYRSYPSDQIVPAV